ncbi:MAG TPA: hypothetical protein VK886_07170 [Vicinamibacterales bacterium]|nr:hypothetical protein [Vicinamibacterales bacterium]
MSAGRVRHAGSLGGRVLPLAAALYAFVLAASPLLHHDIVCELRSRTHCTTCVAGVGGPGLAQASQPVIHQGPPPSPVLATTVWPDSAPRPRRVNGRAPPSAY